MVLAERKETKETKRGPRRSAPREIILKERNPWLTPTESCESDETEDEGMKPFVAPSRLAGAAKESKTRKGNGAHGSRSELPVLAGAAKESRTRAGDGVHREGGESSTPEAEAHEVCEDFLR